MLGDIVLTLGILICWHLLWSPNPPGLLGLVGLNLALDLVTSCYSCQTACCWLGWGSRSIGDPNKSHYSGCGAIKILPRQQQSWCCRRHRCRSFRGRRRPWWNRILCSRQIPETFGSRDLWRWPWPRESRLACFPAPQFEGKSSQTCKHWFLETSEFSVTRLGCFLKGLGNKICYKNSLMIWQLFRQH